MLNKITTSAATAAAKIHTDKILATLEDVKEFDRSVHEDAPPDNTTRYSADKAMMAVYWETILEAFGRGWDEHDRSSVRKGPGGIFDLIARRMVDELPMSVITGSERGERELVAGRRLFFITWLTDDKMRSEKLRRALYKVKIKAADNHSAYRFFGMALRELAPHLFSMLQDDQEEPPLTAKQKADHDEFTRMIKECAV